MRGLELGEAYSNQQTQVRIQISRHRMKARKGRLHRWNKELGVKAGESELVVDVGKP